MQHMARTSSAFGVYHSLFKTNHLPVAHGKAFVLTGKTGAKTVIRAGVPVVSDHHFEFHIIQLRLLFLQIIVKFGECLYSEGWKMEYG